MTTDKTAPLPRTFIEYIRSFGPGLVVMLTWLGAGDVVEAGVSGGNYGYSLMWVIVLAVMMRFLFVSLIAKYQLCNPRGEGVLDGLGRLHAWYPPLVALAAVVMGHVYGSYMAVGIGETWVNLTGVGQVWQWALVWSALALAVVFRPLYGRIEFLFKGLLLLLSASLLGTALWVGPSPAGIVRGALGFALPERVGPFDSLLVAVGMLGAFGGSLMNLVYPYFLEQKGWRGPQYRRVQSYDFLLAVAVMIVLNLAVWTLGAEVIHGRGETVKDLDDLTGMLGHVIGDHGRRLFLLGVFAAVYTSIVGHALGLACLASHGFMLWRAGPSTGARSAAAEALAAPSGSPTINTIASLSAYRSHLVYRLVVVWVLVSPLVWTLPGQFDFVSLTLMANSAQVVLLPFLAGGLWWITASGRFMGPHYRNRWWENLVMLAVFCLALWGAVGSVRSVAMALYWPSPARRSAASASTGFDTLTGFWPGFPRLPSGIDAPPVPRWTTGMPS